MIHLWLPVSHGDIRVFHDLKWHRYDNWESLTKALAVYKLSTSSVCLYVPTLNVTQIIKPMTRAQLRQLGDQGVSYLLEDYVLGSVDDLYVRHVMHNDSDLLLCSISKTLVEQYKQSLSLVNLSIGAILPDFLLLDEPKRADEASVFSDAVTTIMRTQTHAGVAVDDLSLVVSKLPRLESLNVVGSHSAAIAESAPTDLMINQRGQLTPVALPERHALNMNPKLKRAGIPAYWRAVAAVLTATVVTLLVYDSLRIMQYKKLEKGYQQQIYKQYQQWFPSERPPVDLRRTVGSKTVSGGEDANAIFTLMSNVSPLLKQSGLVANRLSFQKDTEQNDVLEMSINASDISALKSLVSKMSSQGINAQLGNVTPIASKVEGIIRITP